MILNISILNRYIRKTFLNENRFVSFLVLFIAVFIFLTFSCKTRNPGQDISPETQRIKNTILLYNALLAEGYRNLNMNPVQEVATVEQAEKLYHHMAALGEADIRMLSQLKNIEFNKIEFKKPDEAVVKTTEVWDFIHVDIKSGEEIYEEKDFVYYITFELQKKGERWMIVKVTASEDDKQSREKKIHPRLDCPQKGNENKN